MSTRRDLEEYQAVKDWAAIRARKAHGQRPRFRLALSCSCGSTLGGVIGTPITDAIKLRDIFLSFHREPSCAVTDTSEDLLEPTP